MKNAGAKKKLRKNIIVVPVLCRGQGSSLFYKFQTGKQINMQSFFPLTEALHLVSTAASHANDAMRRIEKFKKLLEVQEALGGSGGGAGGVRGVRKPFVSRTNY